MSAASPDRNPPITGGENLFFLVPAFTPQSDKWCANLLTAESPHDGSLIFLTTTKSPADRLKAWQSHTNVELPARIGFINLRSGFSTDDSEQITAVQKNGREIHVETIQNPGNLTKIGISLASLLTNWSQGNRRIVICFDSLTTLLQFVDTNTMYRFLHELTSQVRAVDAMAHYHLDPTAHGKQTVSQFMALFDAVVEPDGAGGWQLRTR